MLFPTPWARSARPLPKYGIELTDSIYVVLNMAIMTRVGTKVLRTRWATRQRLRQAACTPRPSLTPKTAISCTSREDNTIMSVNSGYGGNVLLGKKCFALRIASYQGRKEGWMAEHMLILGMQNPQRRDQVYRRCVPVRLRQDQPGHAHSAGDLREKGLQGLDASATISPGCASARTAGCRPSTRRTASSALPPAPTKSPTPTRWPPPSKNTIFTNVVHQPGRQHGLVGRPGQESARGRASTGRASRGMARVCCRRRQAALIPNSRFTAPAKNCPCISTEFDNPQGRSHLRDRLRRPPRQDRSAGVPVLRLGARRVRRLHHGFRDHRCRYRRCRRCPPRPDGYAPVLRLQHGRLLAALAGYGQEARRQSSQDLQRQLVPHRRRGPLHLAGLRRQPAQCSTGCCDRCQRRGGRASKLTHRLRAVRPRTSISRVLSGVDDRNASADLLTVDPGPLEGRVQGHRGVLRQVRRQAS